MSDYTLHSSRYNIISFNEVTLEDYKDTVELSLVRRSQVLRDDYYYIRYKRVKTNIEKDIKLCDYMGNTPLSESLSEFEDTCFYWYARSLRDNNTYFPNELTFISERHFNCGAYISSHKFSHIDNTFTFEIRYNGRSSEYFANIMQTLVNKRFTTNELMDCFWLVTNKTITFNKHTRDVKGNENGIVEMFKVSDTKSFFYIVLPALQSYLYKLSQVK